MKKAAEKVEGGVAERVVGATAAAAAAVAGVVGWEAVERVAAEMEDEKGVVATAGGGVEGSVVGLEVG